jgi:hypothetical protein
VTPVSQCKNDAARVASLAANRVERQAPHASHARRSHKRKRPACEAGRKMRLAIDRFFRGADRPIAARMRDGTPAACNIGFEA